jgi:hypothetical protein
LGEHSIHSLNGSHTIREGQHLLGRDLGPEHGVGVPGAPAAVLHHQRRQVVDAEPLVTQQPLGAQGEVGGIGGQARLLLPGCEEGRADDALAAALALGAASIRSGQHDAVLVVGVEKMPMKPRLRR